MNIEKDRELLDKYIKKCAILGVEPLKIKEDRGKLILGRCNYKTKGNVVIPEFIKEIGAFAFAETGIKELVVRHYIKEIGMLSVSGCRKLEKVLIENTGVIGARSFDKCTSLEEVDIRCSIDKIMPGAFGKCDKLSRFKLDGDVGIVCAQAFIECKSLKKLDITGTIEEISHEAFINTGLENVEFKDGLRSLGNRVFNGCNKLESVIIPDTVEDIGNDIFIGCNNLKYVRIGDKFKGQIESELKIYGIDAIIE